MYQCTLSFPLIIIYSLVSMRGGNLASRTGGNPLPEMEAAQIMTQVLEGVKGIHDKGYMHLDLKVTSNNLSNCLISYFSYTAL